MVQALPTSLSRKDRRLIKKAQKLLRRCREVEPVDLSRVTSLQGLVKLLERAMTSVDSDHDESRMICLFMGDHGLM